MKNWLPGRSSWSPMGRGLQNEKNIKLVRSNLFNMKSQWLLVSTDINPFINLFQRHATNLSIKFHHCLQEFMAHCAALSLKRNNIEQYWSWSDLKSLYQLMLPCCYDFLFLC
jgi:hypothetical protein